MPESQYSFTVRSVWKSWRINVWDPVLTYKERIVHQNQSDSVSRSSWLRVICFLLKLNFWMINFWSLRWINIKTSNKRTGLFAKISIIIRSKQMNLFAFSQVPSGFIWLLYHKTN